MAELLDVETVTEPFDLQTALRYMDENGEFIRFKNDTDDYYIYKETQKRPAIVGGKRKLVEVPLVLTDITIPLRLSALQICLIKHFTS